jgi:protein TonB
MQTNNILSAPLIDIIFDGRNKAYGAYYLRKTYERRIKKSLIVTFFIAAVAIGGTVLANSFKKNSNTGFVMTQVDLTAIDEKKPEEIKKPEEPKPEEKKQEVKAEKYVEMKIVDKEEIKEPPPTQDDILTAKIDTEKRDGSDDTGTPTAPEPENPGKGTGIIDDQPQKVSDEPVTFVEIEAKFDGNWRAFLENNLNGNIPVENNAPFGRYSVMIKFVVDREGKLSDIVALTTHGYGMEEEAIRVIKKSKTWEPAIQNGIPVKAYRRQVITFDVFEE